MVLVVVSLAKYSPFGKLCETQVRFYLLNTSEIQGLVIRRSKYYILPHYITRQTPYYMGSVALYLAYGLWNRNEGAWLSIIIPMVDH